MVKPSQFHLALEGLSAKLADPSDQYGKSGKSGGLVREISYFRET